MTLTCSVCMLVGLLCGTPLPGALGAWRAGSPGLVHLLDKHLSSTEQPQACPIVKATAVDDEEVFDTVFRASRPLLLRGGALDLVKSFSSSADSFAAWVRDKYGDLVVPVDVDVAGKDFNRFDAAKGVMMFPEVREMPLRDFLQAVKSGNASLAVQQAEFDFAYDLGFDLPGAVQWAEPAYDAHHSWLCGLNKTSHAHYDNDDGMLVQLAGSKTVLLVDPRHFRTMVPTIAPHTFRDSAPGSGVGPSGLSALPSLHFSGAPRFPRELATECSLQPGDILFIPAFWWHRVENDGVSSADGLNVAFNWWFFTHRLLRDQLWPLIQRNLFHVSDAWDHLPADGLYVADEPGNEGRWPAAWWPDPPASTGGGSCPQVAWGSFLPEQVYGRFFARSRPAVLEQVAAASEGLFGALAGLQADAHLRNGTKVKITVGDLLHVVGSHGAPADHLSPLASELLASSPIVIDVLDSIGAEHHELWPLKPAAFSTFPGSSATGMQRLRVWLTRGRSSSNYLSTRLDRNIVHWQLQGSATVRLEAPVLGLHRRIQETETEDVEDVGLLCKAGAGDVFLVPSHWWHTLHAADESDAVALQWQFPSHELATHWWRVLETLMRGRGKAPETQRRNLNLRSAAVASGTFEYEQRVEI